MKSINNNNHPGGMLAGISIICHSRLSLSGISALEKTKVAEVSDTNIRLRQYKNTTQTPDKSFPGWNKAFTLIELLVVVLIIGILAAIALPQYQKAVDKTRFTQALIWGKTIRDAEQIYQMENGTYTTDLEELGVELDGCKKQGTSTNVQAASYNCNGGWTVMIVPNSDIKTGASGYVYLPGGELGVEFYFFNDTRLCVATNKTSRAVSVCKSMGGTDFAEGMYWKLP